MEAVGEGLREVVGVGEGGEGREKSVSSRGISAREIGTRESGRGGGGKGRDGRGNSPKLYRRGAFVHGSSLTMVS